MNKQLRLLATLTPAFALIFPLCASAQLEEVIVTASKIEASIQDTPIAVSAFSQDQLDSQLINDTMNLQFTVPNMTMTKQNFTGNDVRIRGIGAGAIGAAGDAGVGIHVNGVYQTASRIFEAQFYDTERVEVLRGPQGTLYGRNTTGGVVNIITAKADPSGLAGQIDGTVGNYGATNARGMLNVPLGETFAIRAAGMMLQRDGFVENVYDGQDIDDRDMWAGRLSLNWTPSDRTEVNFMASYFEEDDNRMRSQKQACNTDPTGILGCLPGAPSYGVANSAAGIAGSLVNTISAINTGAQAVLGITVPGLTGGALGNPALAGNVISGATNFPTTDFLFDNNPDDVRQVNVDWTPTYYTEETNYQFHLSHDFGNWQAFYSVGYTEAEVSSTEDYEKGVATSDWTAALQSLADLGRTPALDAATWAPILEGAGAGSLIPFITDIATGIPGVGLWAGNPALIGLENGVKWLDVDDNYRYAFNNQGVDESFTESEQWSHEVRIQTSFDGSWNFLLGGFYLDYETTQGYIVRSPGLALPAQILPINPFLFPAPIGDPNDPQSESNPNMWGYHNDTRNYSMEATAVFGELYWDVTENLKLTFGGRYSDEEKKAKQRTIYVTFSDLPPLQPNNAYFEPVYDQQEFTWKLNATYNLSDATMMYATVSSSFKSGGFNPISDNSPLLDPSFGGRAENAYFAPEFIDAFEVGIKTTLLDGAMQLNAAGFFYDYQDLQQSKIVNVTSLNQNSDAEITGVELDLLWGLTDNLIFSLNGGYLDTEIKSFLSVDTSNPNAASDTTIAANPLAATEGVVSVNGVNFIPGADATGQRGRCETLAPNPCYGFVQDLSGNQLAGSPELNFNVGLEWTVPMGSMELTLATNYYWQDDYYTSNFNTRNSLVEDWSMWNASARLSGESWYAEAWIKNIEDEENVTGSYLTSTVSSLFTNQFILDPQTYGITLGLRF
ncbi:MAG: TonB-dependent receptor [Proteobacteria bacterium]|nr:TonB-dependent receptor [Pseudomonadota bacterium]